MNDALSTVTVRKGVKPYVRFYTSSGPIRRKMSHESWLSISFQSFQSLKERVSECFPVGRAESIQQGVDCLMVGGLQMILHLVKSIAHHPEPCFCELQAVSVPFLCLHIDVSHIICTGHAFWDKHVVDRQQATEACWPLTVQLGHLHYIHTRSPLSLRSHLTCYQIAMW